MRKSTAQKRKSRSLYVKRRHKKVKGVLLTAFAFGLLGVFFLIKSIIAPAVSAYSGSSSDLKDKDIYSTLLVKVDEEDVIKSAQVLIFQKKDTKLYSINLPVDRKVDLPGRFGEEEYKQILKLANSVGDGVDGVDGIGLLVGSSKNLLKLNLDRYVIAREDSWELAMKAMFNRDVSLLAPWQMRNFLSMVRHNFSTGELLSSIVYARGLNARDVQTVDYEKVADFGLKLRDITLSGDVAKESLGIVVLNGTGMPNVAGEAGEVFQNIGARVSLTANAENEYEKSYLVTDNPLNATVKYIKSYYPDITVVPTADAFTLGEDLLDRGDICVIIGFDILVQQE